MRYNGKAVMNNHDFTVILFAIFTSVSLAIIIAYHSCIFALAIILFVVGGISFLIKPEWFLYFLAFSKVSLDALKLSSSGFVAIDMRQGLSLDGVITGLLLLCAIVYFLREKNITMFKLPGAKLYLLFLMICLLSLSISLDRIIGIRDFLNYLCFLDFN